VVAERCVINKDKRVARSDAPIRIEKEGLLITGAGFTWNGATQKVSILSNVEVVLQRALMPELRRGLPGGNGKGQP
jgi:lipopolysaccharide export system protein LptC